MTLKIKKYEGFKIVGGNPPPTQELAVGGTFQGFTTGGNGGDPDIPTGSSGAGPFSGVAGSTYGGQRSPSPAAGTRWITSVASNNTTLSTSNTAYKFGEFFYLRINQISGWGQSPNLAFVQRQPISQSTSTGYYPSAASVGGPTPYNQWSIPPTLNASMAYTYGSGLPKGDTAAYNLVCYLTTPPVAGTKTQIVLPASGSSHTAINAGGVNTYYLAGANASPSGGSPGTILGGPANGHFWLFESAYISYRMGTMASGTEGITWIRNSDSVDLLDQTQLPIGTWPVSTVTPPVTIDIQNDCGYVITGSGSAHTYGGTTYWNSVYTNDGHGPNTKQQMLSDNDYLTLTMSGQPLASNGGEFQLVFAISEFANGTHVDGRGTISS